ncbi:hypothetical protein [Ancylobacter terrae]|uniref:hypothetical protein n=1 Tax=Ancylobacter sp. sgz301288 TaxID=3342077 RepID=UPI00385E724B
MYSADELVFEAKRRLSELRAAGCVSDVYAAADGWGSYPDLKLYVTINNEDAEYDVKTYCAGLGVTVQCTVSPAAQRSSR